MTAPEITRSAERSKNSRIRKYLSFFRIRFTAGFQYRAAALAGIATQFFWGLMEIRMFMAFYRTDGVSTGSVPYLAAGQSGCSPAVRAVARARIHRCHSVFDARLHLGVLHARRFGDTDNHRYGRGVLLRRGHTSSLSPGLRATGARPASVRLDAVDAVPDLGREYIREGRARGCRFAAFLGCHPDCNRRVMDASGASESRFTGRLKQ